MVEHSTFTFLCSPWQGPWRDPWHGPWRDPWHSPRCDPWHSPWCDPWRDPWQVVLAAGNGVWNDTVPAQSLWDELQDESSTGARVLRAR